MKISTEHYDSLIAELEHTQPASEEQMANIKSLAEGLYNYQKFATGNFEVCFYSNKNLTLNSILEEITGKKGDDIITIHTGYYRAGSESKRHVDNNSLLTFNMIIEGEFEGGDFYLNDKLISEFKKPGDYLIYEGRKEYHHVTPLTSGYRKVLVVWYKQPENKKLM